MPGIKHISDPITLEECQKLVGGYIQILELPEGDQMIINEEGKLMGLEYNVRATEAAIRARAIYSGDWIAGPALILYGDAVLT